MENRPFSLSVSHFISATIDSQILKKSLGNVSLQLKAKFFCNITCAKPTAALPLASRYTLHVTRLTEEAPFEDICRAFLTQINIINHGSKRKLRLRTFAKQL